MRDSHVKQFAGMLCGIASVVFPSLTYTFGRDSSNKVVYFIGIGIGFFIALAGLIISGISIKQAKEDGDNKVKGIIGLVTSIIGISSCLILCLIVGLILLIAWNM